MLVLDGNILRTCLGIRSTMCKLLELHLEITLLWFENIATGSAKYALELWCINVRINFPYLYAKLKRQSGHFYRKLQISHNKLHYFRILEKDTIRFGQIIFKFDLLKHPRHNT